MLVQVFEKDIGKKDDIVGYSDLIQMREILLNYVDKKSVKIPIHFKNIKAGHVTICFSLINPN